MNEMNITSAQYKQDQITGTNNLIIATIDGVEIVVPLDPANTDYAEIQRQVAAGDLTILDAD